MPNVTLCDDPYAAAQGADAVVLVTEWDVLRALDLERLAAAMAEPVLLEPAQHLSPGGRASGGATVARRGQAATARGTTG